MKRLALILLLASGAFSWGAPDEVGDLLKQAQTAATAQKYDDALQIYEGVITEHPEALDRWSTAQQGIVTTLAAKGDLDGAAKAAHVLLDGAPNPQTYDGAVMLTANILSALDKNVGRANQFLNFEMTGTASGVTNPMDTIGYPPQPAREQAFVQLRKQAGDNAMASRLRAYTYLYEGKPREALAEFADGFRRCSNNSDFSYTSDLVLVGLRAVQGHRAGLDSAIQFILFGPNGPDGIANTSDDIPDPFVQYLPAAPEPDKGGLAELTPDDLDALRKVRDAAALYGGDSRLRRDIRHTALVAMQRCNDALDAWGAKGQKEQFLELAYASPEPEVSGPLLACAATAARERALNLGGTNAFWNEVDAYAASHDTKLTRAVDAGQREYKYFTTPLTRIKLLAPNYKLLKTPASFEQHSK